MKVDTGVNVIFPFAGFTDKLPSVTGFGVVAGIMETLDGTRAPPILPAASLAKVFNVTGTPCNVVAISVFAIGGLGFVNESVTVIVNVSLIHGDPGAHTGTLYIYIPGRLPVNTYVPFEFIVIIGVLPPGLEVNTGVVP